MLPVEPRIAILRTRSPIRHPLCGPSTPPGRLLLRSRHRDFGQAAAFYGQPRCPDNPSSRVAAVRPTGRPRSSLRPDSGRHLGRTPSWRRIRRSSAERYTRAAMPHQPAAGISYNVGRQNGYAKRRSRWTTTIPPKVRRQQGAAAAVRTFCGTWSWPASAVVAAGACCWSTTRCTRSATTDFMRLVEASRRDAQGQLAQGDGALRRGSPPEKDGTTPGPVQQSARAAQRPPESSAGKVDLEIDRAQRGRAQTAARGSRSAPTSPRRPSEENALLDKLPSLSHPVRQRAGPQHLADRTARCCSSPRCSCCCSCS